MENNETLEQMMKLMLEARKSSYYETLILLTLLFLCVFAIFAFAYYITPFFRIKHIVTKIFSIMFFIIYTILIVYRTHGYYYGFKNENPGYLAIYKGYFECSSCKSLAGGIFGKGPTSRIIKNTNCVHNWKAIYKSEFEKKYKIDSLKSNN